MLNRTQLRQSLELLSIYEHALVNIATNASSTYPMKKEELIQIASNALLKKKNYISEVNRYEKP